MTASRSMSAFVGLLLIAAPAAADGTSPNPILTPGAVVAKERQMACAFGHTPRLFSVDKAAYEEQARYVFELYGVPFDRHHEYELDHLVPRCIGGADEISNLWPQPLTEARRKDTQEWRICRAVCHDGTMSIEAGQRFFIEGEWR